MTVTDYPDWQTPQAHADRIAVTGVPLLRATNTMNTSAGQSIAGGTDVVISQTAPIAQPGYEVLVSSYMAAGSGTVPFLRVSMIWRDSTTSMVASRRDVVISAGNGPINTLTYYMHGPMHGDEFSVEVVNLDPAIAQTVEYAVNQTSHVYAVDVAKQYAYQTTAPHGYTNPAGVCASGLIARSAPTLAAGTNTVELCALSSGDAVLTVDNSANAQIATVQLLDPAGWATGTVGGGMVRVDVAAGATLVQPLTLPFTPVELKIANNATAGSITPVVTLLAQQH